MSSPERLGASLADRYLLERELGAGGMATMLRRAGGQHVKVRGLRELLAGAKINLEGAIRIASTPERDVDAKDDPKVSP